MRSVTPDLRDDTVLEYRADVTPAALWLLRQLVEQWLVERHVVRDDVDDMLVITNELCTDVVRRGADDAIDVTVRVLDDIVEVEVVQSGGGSAEPAEVDLVAALGDRVRRWVSPAGLHLACRHPIRRAA